ncbi:TPA: AlpA family phage regulatory protein [Enterobacter bugandensis]|nr:AlpA family phage regulatory protein [Escherichia coli]QLO48680.1 AlpA family phage regulatory protein [Enterobacter cloacae]QLR29938.1 AlpA family phage regulatory protein [Enterobacter asburiae]HCM9448438.1 AlpA family phage regulatory protein [Enterobacter bugandensis]HDR2644051.1 AlpA family phage regulatory protein [Enterobacter asburiae]
MNIYLMDLKEVCKTVGFKKASIYSWMNAGEFPKSIKIGRSVRWLSTEVEAWITEKVRASRQEK